MKEVYAKIKAGKRGTVPAGQYELDKVILSAVRAALAWHGKSHPDSTRTARAKIEARNRRKPTPGIDIVVITRAEAQENELRDRLARYSW